MLFIFIVLAKISKCKASISFISSIISSWFIGNCLIISHIFVALSTQWMSSPSRKWRREVSPRFHLIVFVCLVWIKKIRRQGESRLSYVTPVVETSPSDRVAFRILSNINNGAPLQAQVMTLTCWLFLQKSSTTYFWLDFKCGSDLP